VRKRKETQKSTHCVVSLFYFSLFCWSQDLLIFCFVGFAKKKKSAFSALDDLSIYLKKFPFAY